MEDHERELLLKLEPTFSDGGLAIIGDWLDRGDGIAVYRNSEIGHPQAGHLKFVSYGSPAAQLEVLTHEELPDRLPDIGDEINWRYTLTGWYRRTEEA